MDGWVEMDWMLFYSFCVAATIPDLHIKYRVTHRFFKMFHSNDLEHLVSSLPIVVGFPGPFNKWLIITQTQEMCTPDIGAHPAPLRQLQSHMHYESHFTFNIFQPRMYVHSLCCVLLKPCVFLYIYFIFLEWMTNMLAVTVSEITKSSVVTCLRSGSHRDPFCLGHLSTCAMLTDGVVKAEIYCNSAVKKVSGFYFCLTVWSGPVSVAVIHLGVNRRDGLPPC